MLREEILYRFNLEVERLINQRYVRNMPDLSEQLNVPLGKIQDARRGRAISYELLVAFVRKFRKQEVSYEYLLEGKSKPKGSPNLDKAKRFLDGNG
jgi:hypothetical protein